MSPALEARGLTKHYDGTLIVDRVDLVAEAGKITVVVGPNGAGKTTLFNCLSGVDPLDAGSVWHRGENVTMLSFDRLARRGVARTFQRSSLFATLSVSDNLLVAIENRQRRGILRGVVGVGEERVAEQVAEARAVLADLELLPLADVRAGDLPAGTRHLVELARALCLRPDTVLLDEPASGLDDNETNHLHHLLHRLAARDLAVLMIEHDLLLVDQTADVVYVMDAGRVMASGPPSDVLHRDAVRSLLFGRPG